MLVVVLLVVVLVVVLVLVMVLVLLVLVVLVVVVLVVVLVVLVVLVVVLLVLVVLVLVVLVETNMRVGSLVYATDQGLGVLAKSFYDAGVVTDICVIRHGRHPTHDEWYPGAPQVTNLRDVQQIGKIMSFCTPMDAMLFFETPFHWSLIDACRECGVKTIIMPMHECMPERIPSQPDLWLCPSLLDYKWTNNRVTLLKSQKPEHNTKTSGIWAEGWNNAVSLSVPVSVPWRQRTRAEVFVHNAGHGGLKGRNGTMELTVAWPLVKSPARLKLRTQDALGVREKQLDPRIEVTFGTCQHSTLWRDGGKGDVFIFPEKFNGLSLPLQEARAAGMLVMCGDRFPMNTWLPREVHNNNNENCPLNDPETYCNPVLGGLGCSCPSPLISVAGYHKERIGPPYSEYDCAEFDPRQIAAKIDEWYGRDISEYSLQGKAWAEANSWAALKPKYMEVLECLVKK